MLSYRVSVRLIACVLFTALTATVGAAQQRTDFGTLSVQVRPPDAEIFIDGERWTGSEGPGPLEVQVSPGTHRVEFQSPGRQTFVRTISIRAGETLPLNVSLTQAEPEGPPPAEPPPAPRRPAAPPSSRPRAASSGSRRLGTDSSSRRTSASPKSITRPAGSSARMAGTCSTGGCSSAPAATGRRTRRTARTSPTAGRCSSGASSPTARSASTSTVSWGRGGATSTTANSPTTGTQGSSSPPAARRAVLAAVRIPRRGVLRRGARGAGRRPFRSVGPAAGRRRLPRDVGQRLERFERQHQRPDRAIEARSAEAFMASVSEPPLPRAKASGLYRRALRGGPYARERSVRAPLPRERSVPRPIPGSRRCWSRRQRGCTPTARSPSPSDRR